MFPEDLRVSNLAVVEIHFPVSLHFAYLRSIVLLLFASISTKNERFESGHAERYLLQDLCPSSRKRGIRWVQLGKSFEFGFGRW